LDLLGWVNRSFALSRRGGTFRLGLFLLLGRLGPQLERVDAAGALQLLLQQAVHHPVPGRLGFGHERRRHYVEVEMRLSGSRPDHGLVVGVEVRVVPDF